MKAGDVVRLKSNGHRMVVEATALGGLWCCWHDQTGVPQRRDYPEVVLELAEPYKPTPSQASRARELLRECAVVLKEGATVEAANQLLHRVDSFLAGPAARAN
jgi:uncharacterized protein YodC (DUF2158 family)